MNIDAIAIKAVRIVLDYCHAEGIAAPSKEKLWVDARNWAKCIFEPTPEAVAAFILGGDDDYPIYRPTKAEAEILIKFLDIHTVMTID